MAERTRTYGGGFLKSKKGKPDYTARMDTRNQNELERLKEAGLLEEFLEYKNKPGFLGTLKNLGSNVLDVVSRPNYATAGAIEETYGGDPGISGREALNATKRVGRELFSGVGNIQGDKKFVSEVVGEKMPGYGKFQEEHPWQSMATDFGIDMATDPLTYVGNAMMKPVVKGVKKLTKGAGKVIRTTEGGRQALDKLGTAFVPGYRLKQGITRTVGEEAADVAYNTWWQIGKEAEYYGHGLAEKSHKTVKILESKAVKKNPQIAKDFLKRIFPGESGIAPAVSKQIDDLVKPVQESFKTMAETEVGIGRLNKVLDNYFPNNPKTISEFLENVGDFLGSGRGGGALMDYKSISERGKVFRNADELLGFFKDSGLKDENLGQVLADLIKGRTSESVKKVRQHMVKTRMVEGLPDVFEEVPFGTKHFWDRFKDTKKNIKTGVAGEPIVKPGNVLYMPKGNLGFFSTDMQKMLPATVREILEEGGELSIANMEDINKVLSSKKFVGVTTNVKAYQAPKEVVQYFDEVSRRLAAPDDIIKWWDDSLNFWKNTAILSPFFHMRNLVSSGAQNYLGNVNPILGYRDAAKFMELKNAKKLTAKMYGKTIKEWTDELGKHGMGFGGFVGQQTGATGIPVVGKVFEANRWVGSQVEELSRNAMFFDRIRKGRSTLEASLDVKKFHFDYSELTNTEKTLFRRIMPFYSWCVSADTECLTKDGWKMHDKVKIGDAILTYNMDKKCYEWKPVQDKYEGYYNHKLMHFEGQSMDLLCTFDHKCVTQFGFRKAYKISGRYKVPMKVNYEHEDYPASDRILKLIAWVVTDGSSRLRGNHLECVIYQKKEPHLTDIINLVGEDHSLSVHPDTATTCVRIKGETRKEIQKHLIEKDRFWDLIVQLSPRQMSFMQDEMMKAEGNCSYEGTGREFKCFAQVPGVVLDSFQLMTILSGVASNFSSKGLYIRNKPFAKYMKPKIVDYEGIIWCPTTENHTWVARRNGKVIITGNTRHNIPLQLEMIMRAPQKFSHIAELKHAIAGAPESENMPDWWKDQGVWEIKGGKWAYQMGLPYTDLNMQSPMGLTGPLRTMVNVATNHDDFTDRPINQYKGDHAAVWYAVEGAVPAFKRYGIDIKKYWDQYNNPETPEQERKAKWNLIKRLTGVGLLPKVKSDEDRQAIYRLRRALDEFDKYRDAQQQ
jgi:hypothetical protein